ncbi:hypothetical protein AQUCO_00400176v1 [Aquilegia coerulea]|uniref:non-specific serine/threonine protein kinase n=1 Tax=Aquilegia coerulea TaxID=218851 RepID=A0A2G5ETP8_AQUCA|nr:hypothetical protein AQUCO_00400176v1 [Aquilegia coerulea]
MDNPRRLDKNVKISSTEMEMLGEENVRSGTIEALLSDLAKEKPQPFSYEQLHSFTSDFKFKIGSGGFGEVYKGEFPDGVQIAVKVLKNYTRDVMEKQFRSEVGTTGRTYHPNLIKLYGYCNDAKILALIYEYMENGSFDKILFKNHLDIQWVKLYDIAIDIAKGISYLHESQIIHHDIKPGNVLLDSKLSPKVTDFGLARVNRELSLFTQTGFRGTPGYAAPEVFMGPQVKVSSKCDVFSFGMMLFDILGSKRNSKSQEWLPGQVWVHFKKKRLDKIVRDCGIGKDDEADAKTLCVIALSCAQHDPQNRPSMSTVVKMLEGEISPWTPVNPFPYYDTSSESNTRGSSTRARRRGQPAMSESSATSSSTGTRRRGQAPMSESSATGGSTGTRRHGQPPMVSPTFDKRYNH